MEELQARNHPPHLPLPVEREPAPLPQTREPGCLHELFEAQADRRPEATALLHEGGSLTYRELEVRANRLAHLLRFYGAGPGKLVGLFLERSEHPIVALLACLKTGAGYVPIDPVHPEDRIRHIAAEAELTLVLTERALAERARSVFSESVLVVDSPSEALDKQPTWRLTRRMTGVAPDDLAYVIYTSGTTGRPKGVMAEHRHAVRYVESFNRVCGTGPDDRVYQGFSLSFDGSVEEIWMAFSNGSALVVGTKDTARFGNDVARYLTRMGVTYFSTVPTMLSTIAEAMPTLTTLVLSGEMCPPELVARWARPGLRLLNVYGPTEATVNTTVAECLPDRPVTIGRPLPDYDVYILDDHFRPVAPGGKGELFVGGETLARGYLKQPELTASRFVSVAFNPALPPLRLYRTGDLARFNAEGEIELFGRIDDQVKIRGFRVELSEIESVLREHPQIRSACVRLFTRDGRTEIAAYAVAKGEGPVDRNDVLALLKTRLPEYMIPGYLDFLDEMPTLVSGKVDRSRLPEPAAPLVRTDRVTVAPVNDLERRIAAVWERIFKVSPVSVEDDFFLDLGGYSLLAAEMVNALRTDHGIEVAVRDVYRFPTVRKLAARVAPAAASPQAPREKRASSREVFESLPRLTRWTVPAFQAACLLGFYALAAAPFCLLVLLALGAYRGTVAPPAAVAAALVLAFGLWPFFLLLSIAAKWTLMGRYRPGRYPLWGFHYFRWWLTKRLEALSGAGFLAGTPLLPLYYRLMGAKVGRNCHLETALVSAWDLVRIGDDTTIGPDTQLLGYRVEDGWLVVGGVTIGSRCFVGTHSAIGLDAVMEDDSRLDDQSLLPDGAVIPRGEGRRGSPAQPAEVSVPEGGGPRVSLWFGVAQVAAGYGLGIVLGLPGLFFLALNVAAFVWGGWGWLAATVVSSVPAGVVFHCFYAAAMKNLILGRAKPGTYPVASLFYLRKWLVDGLMKLNRAVLLPLYTTLYFPPWLRLMGAKIGPRAELSTVWTFSPDLVDIGEESFFADGCIIGGRRTFRGAFRIDVNRIGRRSFVGNSAILPTGTGLGDNCLLGVVSSPPADQRVTADGTEWLGSPAFRLPHRVKVEGFQAAETYRPTPKLYLQRALIDGLRILIPGYVALVGFLLAVAGLYASYLAWGLPGLFGAAPFIGLALRFYGILAVVALKWLVMGRFEPVIRPLWSPYVWLNEMVNGAYESIMAPALMPFLGTPFLSPLLRLIGVRVGRRAFVETTLFSEFDLVEIGDYAAVNFGAVIQTHLFEDRVFKSSHLRIGEGATVGNLAVVLYDAELGRGASLGPLSLLMKGETQGPGTRRHGIPTVEAP